MPKRSDIMRYKAGDCFEIVLDITDAPDATFQSATFCRGGVETDWPLVEHTKHGRAEFRSRPHLLTLFVTPRLPEGQTDDLRRSVEEILGHLNVKLKYKDSESGSIRECVTQLRVIPCSNSGCDICENAELIAGQG